MQSGTMLVVANVGLGCSEVRWFVTLPQPPCPGDAGSSTHLRSCARLRRAALLASCLEPTYRTV